MPDDFLMYGLGRKETPILEDEDRLSLLLSCAELDEADNSADDDSLEYCAQSTACNTVALITCPPASITEVVIRPLTSRSTPLMLTYWEEEFREDDSEGLVEVAELDRDSIVEFFGGEFGRSRELELIGLVVSCWEEGR
jgi:hypothetical protein